MLDPQFRQVSRKRLVSQLIPSMYDNCLTKIKEELNEAVTVCVTVDAWTDKRMKAFFGITIHFIDNLWNYKSYLLHCKRFLKDHNSVNIATLFDEIINKFELMEKLKFIISDNAANMICAFDKIRLLPTVRNDENTSDIDEF